MTKCLPQLAVLDFKNFDLQTLVIESVSLKQNPLGDSATRRCPVMVPKGLAPAAGWPAVFMLSGFTGNGTQCFNIKPFEPSSALKLDEAVGRGEAPRAVFVFVDAMTKWGGSQFIDSEGMGSYETFIASELREAIQSHFKVSSSNLKWCVMGGSSGGYGALHLASKFPEVFGFAIALAPDSFFEASLLPELRSILPVLRRMGGVKAARTELESGKLMKRKDGHQILNVVAMGLCYAPLENSEPVWPIDPESGLVIEKIWSEWVQHDPLEFLRRRSLEKLAAIYLDAGDRDQFQLQYGTRQIRDLLKTLKVNVHYAGFEGTHFDLGERRAPAWSWLSSQWRT